MDYSNMPRHHVICVDMKSFYASCECILRGLDPLTAKLAVVGDVNRDGSVVLASTPALKKEFKINTGSRLFEIKKLKQDDIIIAQARMKNYLAFSNLITDIFHEFVPPEAIHTYSVDESWITLDGTERLWGSPEAAARKIRSEIYHYTGLFATVGLGDNKFLAKVVLDNYGKYTGFAECRYEDVQRLLHPLPVGEMWGVGRQMQKHFQHMGIYTIGDLANFDLAVLKEKFGVNGERLYLNANGIDSSPVLYSADAPPQSVFGFDNGRGNSVIKSVGRGATLLRDYINLEDIKLVIRELSEEVCEVMRSESIAGKTIHLSVDYSKKEKVSGFSRQKTIKYHTNDVVEIINTCYELLEKFHKKGAPARLIRVSVGRFIDEHYVLMTFDKDKTKRRILADISDKINSKFGKGTLRRASSYIDASVAKDRMKKIAGHFE